MDSMAEEQIDYQGGGAIPALADEELMGEDDEYDDLYNDVNVGDGLFQFQQPEAPPPSTVVGNGRHQAQKTDVPEQRVQAGGLQGLNIPVGSVDGKYMNAGSHFPPQNDAQVAVNRPNMESASYPDGASVLPKGSVQEMTHDAQVRNMDFQGSTSGPPRSGVDPSNMLGRVANEPAHTLSPGTAVPQGALIPANQMSVNANVNRPMVNEHQIQPSLENGGTMLFVGELHWWTTDAELESVLSQYGRVKEIKFFDERASGKSKGYCQVEFYDAAATTACKEGMNGHVFNGRACVVAFASPQTLKQMGASLMNKNQGQPQSQPQGRRPMNDGGGRGGNMNYQSGDGGRNYGRGGWGRGGQGPNRGPGGGAMRGRGPMGAKNLIGSSSGAGCGVGGGGYGQGLAGPGFGAPAGGMMHPQNMMGGFDPTYMGRGGGYGGFSGPSFPGILPSFPAVNAMRLAGLAPHVNPAFFNRGMTANGMGMMGSSGMDVPHPGMWADSSMGGWGVEEHGRGTRESSYGGGDDGASDYGYGEANHEKGASSSAASREKERGSERDYTDRRQQEEREQNWDRSERDHRHREEKDSYRDSRQRDRDSTYDDDWDKGQSSSRSRSRSRAMPDEDHRSRSRDVDYGKRRRLPSE